MTMIKSNNEQFVSLRRYKMPTHNYLNLSQEEIVAHSELSLDGVHTSADLLGPLSEFIGEYNPLVCIVTQVIKSAEITPFDAVNEKGEVSAVGVHYKLQLSEGSTIRNITHKWDFGDFCDCVMVFTSTLDINNVFDASVFLSGFCGKHHGNATPLEKPASQKPASQKPASKKRLKRDARKMAA